MTSATKLQQLVAQAQIAGHTVGVEEINSKIRLTFDIFTVDVTLRQATTFVRSLLRPFHVPLLGATPTAP